MKNKLCILILFVFYFHYSSASHLMGGSMTYQYMGYNSTNNQYHYLVQLQLFRDCISITRFPLSLDIGIYSQDTANPTALKVMYRSDSLILVDTQYVQFPPIYSCINSIFCVQEGIYQADIYLFASPGGYHMMAQINARSYVVNLAAPLNSGFTFYAFIPPNTIVNHTPFFNNLSVPFNCAGDTVTLENIDTDPDGDSLSYGFVVPFDSYTHGTSYPLLPTIITLPPYTVPFNIPTYSFTQPFGPGGFAFIDSITGLTKFFIPNQGNYYVCIQVNEFRNGILIGSTRRDIEIVNINCPLNQPPLLTSLNTTDTIIPGHTFCFPVEFTDANNDSIYVHAYGNIFDTTFVNPAAALHDFSGSAIATSSFCWTPDSSEVSNAPYQFTVRAIDNGCYPDTTIEIYSVYVKYQSPLSIHQGNNNVSSQDIIYVFPNPSHDHLTLSFKSQFGEKGSLKIRNMLGKLVFEKNLTISPLIRIEYSELQLEKGIYVVEIVFGNYRERKKILVE